MKDASYYRSKDPMKTEIYVGGSITGRPAIGEIDLTVHVAFKNRKGGHTVNGVLGLAEAKALLDLLKSEIEEVEHRVDTGKWKHELEDQGEVHPRELLAKEDQ